MKVCNVYIKNFRSISEASFNLSENVTAIAGGNESGKSNVLKAIKRFLSQEDFEDADKYQLSSEETSIRITFNNFSDEEKDNISRVLRKSKIDKVVIERVGNNYQIIDSALQTVIDLELKKESEENKIEKITNKSDSVPKEESVEETTVEDDRNETEISPQSGEELNLLPKTIKEITKYVLEYTPNCELISDVSSLITGDNILLEKLFADKYSSKDEENRYSTIKALLEVGNITKLDLQEKDINKRIQILRKKSAEIAIRIRSAWSQEDVKLEVVADSTHLVIHFRDGKNIPDSDREDDTKWIWTLPENRSSGFRWYVTFYAKYLSRIKKNNDDDIVFLIDDAGLGLNKAAQIDLLKEFSKIASQPEKKTNASKQVVYVSHSKYMFDWDMRKQILVANKENGQGTKIDDFWWEKFSRNNLPAPLDELGVNWLEDLLQEKNLIVEGHSDGYVINHLLALFSDQLETSDTLNGFKLIPGNNIAGQFDLAKLCIADDRKFLLLFDSDDAGNGGKKGANNNGYKSISVGALTGSPIEKKNFITIEDLLPTSAIIDALNQKGRQYFKEEWHHIDWIKKPGINESGIVAAIEKRLHNDYTEIEVKDFMKGKYFLVIIALENINISDFDENQMVAVINFFKNLNKTLIKIGN